jgi:glutamate synthase (NADPH/NADH) large chain
MTGGYAVILGPTGRNVGAGMSGGLAFVLDLDRDLVNGELVDVADVSDEYEVALREIVHEHAAATESAVATGLLDCWPDALHRFSVIVPRDYRRVLEATRQARAAGEDVDVAVMAAARG